MLKQRVMAMSLTYILAHPFLVMMENGVNNYVS